MKQLKIIVMLAILCISGSQFLLVNNASASGARADALMLNPAFEDYVDIFTFPQLAAKYRNGVYIDAVDVNQNLRLAAGEMSGGILVDVSDTFILGLFVNQPVMDRFHRFSVDPFALTPESILEIPFSGQAWEGQIFHLMLANTSGFGISLRVHNWSSDDSTHQGIENAGRDTHEQWTGIGFNLGYTMGNEESGENHLFLSLDTQFVTESYDATWWRVQLGDRSIIPASWLHAWVFGGALQYTILAPNTGDSSHLFTLPVFFGARITPHEMVTVGVTGGIELWVAKLGVKNDASVAITLPFAEAAVEFSPVKWFHIRSAFKGGYASWLTENNLEHHPKADYVDFRIGIGFSYMGFALDGVISRNLLTDGPDFIGGTAPGTFIGLSLSYNWDALLRSTQKDMPEAAAPATEPEPAPAPAPEPQPEEPQKDSMPPLVMPPG